MGIDRQQFPRRHRKGYNSPAIPVIRTTVALRGTLTDCEEDQGKSKSTGRRDALGPG